MNWAFRTTPARSSPAPFWASIFRDNVTGLTFGQRSSLSRSGSSRSWSATTFSRMLGQFADWLLALAARRSRTWLTTRASSAGTYRRPVPWHSQPADRRRSSRTAELQQGLPRRQLDLRSTAFKRRGHGRQSKSSALSKSRSRRRRVLHEPHSLGASSHQKDTAGNCILPFAAAGNKGSEALDDSRWRSDKAGRRNPRLPGLHEPLDAGRRRFKRQRFSDYQANTAFIFGNMRSMAFGDKGEMEVDQFTSGSFGGKEIALTDQRGIVYRRRFALTRHFFALRAVGYTSAS